MVIPARNVDRVIGDQIESLISQTVSPGELIVVDNASTDRTMEAVRRYASNPLLKFPIRIAECRHPGVNRARNTGIAQASSDLILLCDADDIVADTWVAEMSRCLETAPLVSGLPVPFTNRDAMTSDLMTLSKLPHAVPPREPEWNDIQLGIGCSLGLHRSVWEQLGGFSESIHGSFDENEFVVRAALIGHPLVLCNEALVAYFLNDSIAKRFRRAYQGGRNKQVLRRRIGWQPGNGECPRPSQTPAPTASTMGLASRPRISEFVARLIRDIGAIAGVLKASQERSSPGGQDQSRGSS